MKTLIYASGKGALATSFAKVPPFASCIIMQSSSLSLIKCRLIFGWNVGSSFSKISASFLAFSFYSASKPDRSTTFIA
jgi:hypothetical protein